MTTTDWPPDAEALDRTDALYRRMQGDLDRLHAEYPDLLATIDVDGTQYLPIHHIVNIMVLVYGLMRRHERESAH